MIKNARFSISISRNIFLQKNNQKLLITKNNRNSIINKSKKIFFKKKSHHEALCIPDQILDNQIQKQTVNYHIDELRERILISIINIFLSFCICLSISKDLLIAFEINGLKNNYSFLQLNPGEFFFTSLEIAINFGIICSFPSLVYQISSYTIPGLTKNEKNFYIPIILGSIFLFVLGLIFSYYILSPFALNFFSTYSDGLVESTLSIKQYFDFYIKLMFSTGIGFQIPIILVILGKSKLVTSNQMLSQWRYVIIICSIAAAVITPTTDPVTQLITCLPLIGLYFLGVFLTKLSEN